MRSAAWRERLFKRRTVVWVAILAFFGFIVYALYPPPTQAAVFAPSVGWTVQVDGLPAHPWPLPANANGNLSGVSCLSDRFCEAVGELISPGLGGLLALAYRGGRWYDQAIPAVPRGVKSSGAGNTVLPGNLDQVSCATEVFCVAVGYISQPPPQIALPRGLSPAYVRAMDFGNVSEPMVGIYNGASWTLQMLSGPFWSGRLAGVSCPAVRFCMAVGERKVIGGVSGKRFKTLQFKSTPMTFTYNGRGWAFTKIPASLDRASFYSVSCVTTSFCEAVGYGSASLTSALNGNTDAAIAKYDGKTWVAQALPVQVSGAALYGVSCVSRVFCEAVGKGHPTLAIRRVHGHEKMTLGTRRPLVEEYNGASWSTQAASPIRVAPELATSLDTVSCASVTFCEAIGTWSNSYGMGAPLSEGYDGRRWVVQGNPLEPPYNYKGFNAYGLGPVFYSVTVLYDVSCTRSACEAVGVISPKQGADTRLYRAALIERHTSFSSHPSRVGIHR